MRCDADAMRCDENKFHARRYDAMHSKHKSKDDAMSGDAPNVKKIGDAMKHKMQQDVADTKSLKIHCNQIPRSVVQETTAHCVL